MSGETKCPCCGNTLKERVSIDGLAIVHECQTWGCFFRCNCMMVDKIMAAMELVDVECLREQLLDLRFRPWDDLEALERVRKSGGVMEICDMLDCVEAEITRMRKMVVEVFK